MFQSVGLPHGFCFLWNPQLLWLNIASDSLIALAYFLIPLALIGIVRKRRDIPINGVFLCFAAFIIACGITHIMEVVTLWFPIYWVSGALKAATAAISVATLVLMVRISPGILAIPDQLDDRRFRELIEDAPDAILQVDANGAIVVANRTAERIFGYSREELLGISVERLIPIDRRGVHGKYRENFVHSFGARPMGEGPNNLFACRKDGTEVPVEIALSPVKTENGVLVTAMIRDVSDRKRIERELELERAQRSQRIEVLARISSGLAHEIKNPLAIIQARASDLAELASEGEVERAEIERTCASIVQTSDRALRILRGVAAMARMGAHDPMQGADVGAIVQQAVELVEGRYRESGICLETAVPAGLPPLECREVQISQILVNLLNNAFDAVEGDPRSERWVRIQASVQPGAEHENHDRLEIDVIDGGPGVAPEHKERLMQTFFTTKSMGAGIGIGLSVSRAIAEDHGGQLELRDCCKHTCFRLTLPVHAAQEQGAAA